MVGEREGARLACLQQCRDKSGAVWALRPLSQGPGPPLPQTQSSHETLTLSRRGGRCFLRRRWRLRRREALLCSVELLNLSGGRKGALAGRGRCGDWVPGGKGRKGLLPWGRSVEPYLLVVSSSSESPRLVLSSSLVMRVEELSYPAKWRSSLEGPLGLWPPAEDEWQLQAPSLLVLTLIKARV